MAVRFQNERLLAARVELGLTQEQAAQIAGVDVRTYRRYESGEVNAGGDFNVNRASRRQIVHKLASELGIDERDLVSEAREQSQAPTRGPLATIGHVLPRARHFVGREALLERLRSWAEAAASAEHVITIVGVGGAGKTSLCERALANSGARSFVWSFYEDARVDAFFDALIARLGGKEQASRGELVDRATLAAERDPGVVLLLDGIEAIQARGDAGKAAGELADSRMRLFLRHIARGLGRARALVTSRSALTDLAGWEGSGATTIALTPLSQAESVELLRRWGVRASPAAFASAVGPGGGHALSVTMMGSYVSSFLGGRRALATSSPGGGTPLIARRCSACSTSTPKSWLAPPPGSSEPKPGAGSLARSKWHFGWPSSSTRSVSSKGARPRQSWSVAASSRCSAGFGPFQPSFEVF